MPNLLKECCLCKKMRDAETEFHYNGNYYSGGIKKKRKDCVYCCRKRRSEYFKNLEKRDAINKRRRRNYQTDSGARKEKNRTNALKALYGLSIDEFNSMREKQSFRCAICKIHETEAVRKKLYVDHDHITNKNRGLLCAKCNSAIGLLKEDIEVFKQAIKYLKSKKLG